jgi:hypothetical protein
LRTPASLEDKTSPKKPQALKKSVDKTEAKKTPVQLKPEQEKRVTRRAVESDRSPSPVEGVASKK